MSSMKKKISNLQIISRVAMVLSTVLLLVQPLAITAQAQPAPEVTIDRMFRYDSSAPSNQGRQLLGSFKKWMGAYQRIRKDGNSYVAIFDSGSLPIDAKFKANGSIESMSFGCPISRSLSINDAPEDLRKTLSKCAGFKS
jgi:hypothetical protein